MNQNIPLCEHIQSLTSNVILIFWLFKHFINKVMKDVLSNSFITELQFLIIKQANNAIKMINNSLGSYLTHHDWLTLHKKTRLWRWNQALTGVAGSQRWFPISSMVNVLETATGMLQLSAAYAPSRYVRWSYFG